MIFAFLSRYETCLSISVNISCNFQICKYDEITTSLLSSFYFIYKIEQLKIFTRKISKMLEEINTVIGLKSLNCAILFKDSHTARHTFNFSHFLPIEK